MKVVLLDETTKRRLSIAEKLESRGHVVTLCRGSGEFLEALSTQSPGKVIIDLDAWKRGSAMFRYFDICKRILGTPVVFFNAHETFTTIADRPRHDGDVVLPRSSSVEFIVDGV